MTTKHKLSEVVAISPAATWVPLKDYRQFVAMATLEAADSGEGISIQLRKATSSAGANAADHGTAVTASSTASNTDLAAMAAAYAADLGETAGGVAYTHVSATVTATGSPTPTEELSAIMVRTDARFS